ncbi:hypothetical protein JKP88DRAFT_240910 [Tribonema minus]|uniref:Uncharacterized protein n=1 Tax=Tribonema minus TaxID=303371 RepID=A0A835Z5Z4_9STRA|nr:hypothetical protein JKP88DRAFT_240910 [Tribonema minus]
MPQTAARHTVVAEDVKSRAAAKVPKVPPIMHGTRRWAFGFKKNLVMRGERAFYYEINKLVPALRHLEKALDESVTSAILREKKDVRHIRSDYFFVIMHEDGRVFGLHVEYDEDDDHEDDFDRLKAILKAMRRSEQR